MIDLVQWNSNRINESVSGFFKESSNSLLKIEEQEIGNILDLYTDQILNPRRRTGLDQKQAWEKGWDEIAQKYKSTNSLESLLPQYYNKDIFRFKGSFYKSNNKVIEADFVHRLISDCIKQFVTEESTIIELGCGTGHNLVHLSKNYPDLNLIGYEYADSAVQLINKYSKDHNLKISSYPFDYYNCSNLAQEINLLNHPIIYTCASLEQLGGFWQPIYKQLSSIKDATIIHIEPFSEIYNQSSIYDLSSLSFHHARGYLSGYASFIHLQESLNRLNIIEKHRTTFGTTFHEPYNVMIWKKK